MRAGLLTAMALGLFAVPAAAAPLGWRGDGTNRYPAAQPPLTWSTTENVRWSAELPAPGNASPLVVKGRVCVTAEPTTILCADADTGQLRWRREVSVVDALEPAEAARVRAVLAEADALGRQIEERQAELDRLKRSARRKGGADGRQRLEALSAELEALKTRYDTSADYRTPREIAVVGTASSSPASDGESVFAVFGNGVVARFDLDGKLLWAKWFGVPSEEMNGYFRGQAASPLLVAGRLIVPLRKLRALDPATGRELWKSVDYRDFGTPTVTRLGGVEVVVTPSGEAVRVSDGKVLGRGLGAVYYVGPIVEDGRAYFVGSASDVELSTRGHARARAVKLPASGESVSGAELWDAELDRERYYGTPLLHAGRLHLLNRYDLFTVLDAATGRQLEQRTLPFQPGQVFPSLVLAGDHLFAGKETGEIVVLEAAPPFRQVALNKLEELRSTPVFEGRRIYVRGAKRLWCLESAAK